MSSFFMHLSCHHICDGVHKIFFTCILGIEHFTLIDSFILNVIIMISGFKSVIHTQITLKRKHMIFLCLLVF